MVAETSGQGIQGFGALYAVWYPRSAAKILDERQTICAGIPRRFLSDRNRGKIVSIVRACLSVGALTRYKNTTSCVLRDKTFVTPFSALIPAHHHAFSQHSRCSWQHCRSRIGWSD